MIVSAGAAHSCLASLGVEAVRGWDLRQHSFSQDILADVIGEDCPEHSSALQINAQLLDRVMDEILTQIPEPLQASIFTLDWWASEYQHNPADG